MCTRTQNSLGLWCKPWQVQGLLEGANTGAHSSQGDPACLGEYGISPEASRRVQGGKRGIRSRLRSFAEHLQEKEQEEKAKARAEITASPLHRAWRE